MVRTLLGALALSVMAIVPLMPSDAFAQWTAGGAASELTLDRADENSVVRLSSLVAINGQPAAAASAVYIQFGFMGCQPCERIATLATSLFDSRVTMLYVHLDDVLLGGMNQRAIWTQLYETTRSGPYSEFIPVRRGSSQMMRDICGASANPPSGVLLRPDGTVHAVLLAPTEDEARAAFESLLAAL